MPRKVFVKDKFRKRVIVIFIAKGRLREVIVLRLVRGEDLRGGIFKACEKYGVINGVIISIVGSLNGASYYDPVMNEQDPSGVSYADAIELSGPVEVLSAQGEICHSADGTIQLHVHATFADSEGRAYGGHLIGEENKVLNVLNVFIGIIEGVDMGFAYEDVLGADSFCPREIRTKNQ
jgi:predicted DNA-binding protein with PD1-like motif